MSAPLTAQIAVPVPLRGLYHYTVPPHLDALTQPGVRVRVRFAGRLLVGYVVARDVPPPPQLRLRPLELVLDPTDDRGQVRPTFGPDLLKLCRFAADYYRVSLGELLRGAHPPGINEKSVPALRALPATQPPLQLSAEAQTLWAQLLAAPQPLPLKPLPPAAVRQLIQAQLAQRCELFFEQRVKPRFERAAVALAPAPTEPRQHGGRVLLRDQIHAWLAGRGVQPVREIKKQFPQASAHLKQLQAEGAIELREIPQQSADRFEQPVERDRPPQLNAQQSQAVRQITGALSAGQYGAFLLHGITGSGKTEVYLRAIEAALAQDKGALMLVPEIALTPQLVGRLRARLGDVLAILHSGLSEAARFAQWQRLKRGQVRVAVGARSAVFAPVPRLGVIIVDEEHDPSYKQQDGVRYHARDLALMRAAQAQAVALLGSATPSLESELNAQRGKLTRLVLTERPTGGQLPQVQLIDLRSQPPAPDDYYFLSRPLRAALSETLAHGEQAILFLNRRGYASAIQCTHCGQALSCVRCDLPFTWHQREQRLRCHHCDSCRPQPPSCPHCAKGPLQQIGRGTERLEQALQQLYPQARIARMDRDEITTVHKLEQLLDQVRARQIDILLGTQMVTKGHDFPGVSLVGIIAADAGLNLPDLRAAERSFQQLTQVAGRAGRGHRPGRVLVQCYEPASPALSALVTHDHVGFATQELKRRQERAYPPFSHLAALRFSGGKQEAVHALAQQVSTQLKAAGAGADGSWLRGPAPAALPMLRDRHRYMLLLFAWQRTRLQQLLDVLEAQPPQLSGDLQILIDVDPHDFM